MKRHLLLTSLLTLALPAGASASTGLVLKVDPHHRTIEVVDARHVVSAYHYRGKLPRLHSGSWISFSRSAGNKIGNVLVRGGRHRVSFKARVVRSSKHGLVLRLSDGKVLRLSSRALRRGHHGHRHAPRAAVAAPNVTVNIQGLQPGETVLVTETVDSNGNITITITLPFAGNGGGEGGPDQDVTGTITQVSATELTISSPDHGTMTFVVDDPGITDGFLVGDQVDVTYSQLSSGALDASDVEYVENDALGTVQSVSAGSLTLIEDGTGQAMTFIADPADGVFDGIAVGEHVDVTYHQAAAGLVADNVDDGSGD